MILRRFQVTAALTAPFSTAKVFQFSMHREESCILLKPELYRFRLIESTVLTIFWSVLRRRSLDCALTRRRISSELSALSKPTVEDLQHCCQVFSSLCPQQQ